MQNAFAETITNIGPNLGVEQESSLTEVPTNAPTTIGEL